MPRMKQVGGMVKKSGDTMTGGLTGTTLSMSGEVSGATINDQFSNMLSGDLLGMSTTLKFLNTLLGTPTTDAANMIDVSTLGHNGTYKGTWAAAQRVNKGFGWMLSPNGTDNYISLGDSDDFSFGDGVNDVAFTIAGVIEVVASASWQSIVCKWNQNAGAELREWLLGFTPTETLEFVIYDESANVSCTRTTDAPLSVGFHTIVVTYSGVGGAAAANGITIYVDGAVVASTATNNASYVAMENLTQPVYMAARDADAIAYLMLGDFTPPIIDKGTVWTALKVAQFHNHMKGVYNL